MTIPTETPTELIDGPDDTAEPTEPAELTELTDDVPPTTPTTPTTTPRRKSHTPRWKRQLNVYVMNATHAALKAIQERDGVPYGAQVDRAVRLWAEHKGIEVPHGKPRSTDPGARGGFHR